MLPLILGAVRAAGAAAGAASSAGGAAIGSAGRGIGAALSGSGTLAEKAAVIGKNLESGLKPVVDGMNRVNNLAGGLGKVVGAIGDAGKVIGQLPLAPLKLMTAQVQMLGNIAGEVAATPIKMLSQAMLALQAPVLIVADSLKGFVGAVGAMGSAVSDFVKLANPIYVVKFNMAMEDLTASIGKILTPVLEASTAIVRAFADVIFKLSDPLQRVMSAFFDPLTKVLPSLVDAMSPFIEIFTELANVFATVMKPIMEAMIPIVVNVATAIASITAAVSLPLLITLFTVAASAVVTLVAVFGPFIAILAAVGWAIKKLFFLVTDALGLGGTKASGGSVGAAVRPATIGSVEDYGKKAQQAAFSLGTAASTPESRTADGIDKLVTFFTVDFWGNLKKAVLEALPETPGKETIKSAKEAARDVDSWADRQERSIRRGIRDITS